MTWPKGLTRLELDHSETAGEGLGPILMLPSITNFGLLWTRVTREGHNQFRKVRPRILVWSGDTPQPDAESPGQPATAVRDLQ